MADRSSLFKQIVGGIVITLVVGGTAPWWWTSIVNKDEGGGPPSTNTDGQHGLPCQDPHLSLSKGSGTSGTALQVTGTGFLPNQDVDVRFVTDLLAPARTDGEGTFTDDVIVPGSLDTIVGQFGQQQFEISASTSGCSDTAPFLLLPP